MAETAGVMLAGAVGVASPDAGGVTSSGAAGGSRHPAWSRFDFLFGADRAPLPRIDASSYPVTRLATFALTGAFDK